ENGCKDYLGIDISEIAVERLKVIFPEYRFICVDISELKIEEKFDLVFMIDVTQHIVSDEKFRKSMEFVKSILKNNGYFFVSSWLKNNVRNTYYEKSRGIEYYKENFPDYNFSEPVQFSDKFLMIISKNPIIEMEKVK
ncbi:MAG: class I SAM-dependent methyltransferase, partial [Candidatus Helarchaeota archaeon]|nr:class I SAM-dependent methyltransferase [Candidatus Helarchaeota archaeon]